MNDLENKAQTSVLALGAVTASSLPHSLRDSPLQFSSMLFPLLGNLKN